MKNILVTGGAGFIGSNFIFYLCLVFQIRLKQIVELAITVKHLRCFVNNLMLHMLLRYFIILKDKVL